MRRALVVALASWLCAVAPGLAQNQAKLPLVGVLRVNTVDTVEPMATMFRNALAALGRIDDRNIRLETRLAEGHAERLPELARSLARENPAVMVAFGEGPIRAAQQATSTIPIIGVADDLVESGLISSLAKPGGNTTGVSILATELDAKRIEPTFPGFSCRRGPSSRFWAGSAISIAHYGSPGVECPELLALVAPELGGLPSSRRSCAV